MDWDKITKEMEHIYNDVMNIQTELRSASKDVTLAIDNYITSNCQDNFDLTRAIDTELILLNEYNSRMQKLSEAESRYRSYEPHPEFIQKHREVLTKWADFQKAL